MNDIKSIPSQELRHLANKGFGLAYQILRHREDAADAVQDAMFQVFRKHDRFDFERGTIQGWFLKIVRNRCLDMLKKSKPVTNDSATQRVIASDQPEKIVEQNELMDNVRQALSELPEDAQEIILLRDFHSLPYSEIGEIIGVPVGTVMSRLHRARLQLRNKVLKR